MEVRSEMSLKKSLPSPLPLVPEPSPAPAETEEDPLPEPTAEPCSPREENCVSPPTLELLTSPVQLDASPCDSEPPRLKPVTPSVDHTPMELDCDMSTSLPSETLNGHISDPPLLNGDLHTACNRRTNVLFRKSKSASPQKPSKAPEAASPPPLGAKTFLSVVIPRLETLLLPKKRTRSSSASGEEEEETPIKRLGTGTDTQRGLGCEGSHFEMDVLYVVTEILWFSFLRNNKRFCGGEGGSVTVAPPVGAPPPLRLRVQHLLQWKCSLQLQVSSGTSKAPASFFT